MGTVVTGDVVVVVGTSVVVGGGCVVVGAGVRGASVVEVADDPDTRVVVVGADGTVVVTPGCFGAARVVVTEDSFVIEVVEWFMTARPAAVATVTTAVIIHESAARNRSTKCPHASS